MMLPTCKPRYFTETDTGDHRVICTCGYSYRTEGPFSYNELRLIDNHRPPLPSEPPLKVEGFVSGLP